MQTLGYRWSNAFEIRFSLNTCSMNDKANAADCCHHECISNDEKVRRNLVLFLPITTTSVLAVHRSLRASPVASDYQGRAFDRGGVNALYPALSSSEPTTYVLVYTIIDRGMCNDVTGNTAFSHCS